MGKCLGCLRDTQKKTHFQLLSFRQVKYRESPLSSTFLNCLLKKLWFSTPIALLVTITHNTNIQNKLIKKKLVMIFSLLKFSITAAISYSLERHEPIFIKCKTNFPTAKRLG